MSSPDWGKLYSQGRCKALGVPWSEEELHAVYVLKIPVELVRKGVLTKDEAEEEVTNTKPSDVGKPLHQMSKVELLALADQLGIEVPAEMHRMSVISLIIKSKEKKEDSNLSEEDETDPNQKSLDLN